MNSVYMFVHGKCGNALEAKHYEPLLSGSAVFGVDYNDEWAWEDIVSKIKSEFKKLKTQFENVNLIAYSIGAFFSMNALQNENVKKAFFVSPMLDMLKLNYDMMSWCGVSENELREKKIIATNFGEDLLWEKFSFVKNSPIDWKTRTSVLYAENDNLTQKETVIKWISCHNSDLTIMPNGEHWFHTEEQMAFLDEWFNKSK